MRKTLATSALLALVTLAGCAGSDVADPFDKFEPNCAEQSSLAQLGRTDGRQITITCPTATAL